MVKRDLMMRVLLLSLLAIVFILVRLFIIKPYTIKERDANLYLNKGDHVWVVKTEEPDYGDLVLYMVDEKSYIGRIVAKSGDQVTSIEDIFYLNQEVVDEGYLEELKKSYLSNPLNEAPYTVDFSLDDLTGKSDSTVPQDNYLILNDDRRKTADSREFGLIPLSKIKGVISFRVYPLTKFGFIETGVSTGSEE